MKAKKTRLVAVREPNGRLQRSTEDAIEARSPAALKRLRDAVVRGMADREWGTEAGRLFLAGKITPSQAEAARRWAILSTNARRVVGAVGYPGKCAFAPTGNSRSADPDSERGKRQVEIDRAILQDMMEAHAVLIAAGQLAEATVRSVCENDRAVEGYEQLKALDRGLSWLAQHWGLTPAPRNVRLS